MTENVKSQLLSEEAQAVLDRHAEATMKELEAMGVRAIGAVIGVLYKGETSLSWCIADGVKDRENKPAEPIAVAHEIAIDMARATT